MPQQPGEVSLLTLFADVHYFFTHPDSKPSHHRFDKSSYVYLYYNAGERRARIEIANHAGTPEQDAFMGYLDTVQVYRSHVHPNLFTITVDASRSISGSLPGSPVQDTSQWHLPAPDHRNEGKYMFRLHTLDVYFWTTEDANNFLDAMRKTLQPHQLKIVKPPSTHLEHKDGMSPVVQKLEQLAVTRGYQHRSNSVSTTQSFPGPPTVPATVDSVIEGSPKSEAGGYMPMAYNPAAPAKPEPIAHREKTPPPIDAESGTGLTSAVHDHPTHYTAPPSQAGHQNPYPQQHQQHQPYLPGPPSRQTAGSFPPPPPMAGTPPSHLQRATPNPSTQPYGGQSFAPPPPGALSPYGQTPTPSAMPPSYSTYPQQQYANYPQSPGFTPQSPGYSTTPLQSPGMPPGGYAQYHYGQQPVKSQAEMYAVHSQAYRPTEAEAAHGHGGHRGSVGQAGPGVPGPGRFEIKVDKVEKGVGRFLKKLDKKL
ncbi:hypothetical protein K490DRAFT_72769 [Saccharata proteae CBS 121410]|uniref:RNA recognition motif-containing protein n=1 Tax=Saccharata proteae CBS 121410 TaxID=1314787 RepID=A0A6A5YCC7_9PEZI|nr:hypothetical protein K490DRAFT_72769 [Saccharata proteae CBS 121410]